MLEIFSLEGNPLLYMRELYCGCVCVWILYYERGDCERKKRKLQQLYCRLYPFIYWIIIKEVLEIFFGEHSPH